MAIICGGLSGIRVAVMLSDAALFDSAMRMNLGRESSVDLLSFFINYRHPVLTPVFSAAFDFPLPDFSPAHQGNIHNGRHTAYLGWLSLLLIGIGLLRRDWRRPMLPWLALLLMFFVLRGRHGATH